MSRPRIRQNKELPKYLYFDPVKGFRIKLVNGKRRSLGFDRSLAIGMANSYNIKMRGGEFLTSLINDSTPNRESEEWFCNHIDKIHKTILEQESPSTKVAKMLANDIERAKQYFQMPPNDIGLQHVTDYIEKFHGNSSNEVFNKKIGFLKKLFSWAVDDGIMQSNPAELKKRRKLEKKKRLRLTKEEYKAIHKIAPLFLQTAMDLALQTSQARLEVSRIKYRMLKPCSEKNGCVWYQEPRYELGQPVYGTLYINRQKTIEKEESHVAIPIGQKLKNIIDKSRADKIHSPYIVHRLPTKKSNPISAECDHITQLTPKYISSAFSEYRDKCGLFNELPIEQRPTFHEIRALSAILFKDQGYNPQSRMAHSDAESTKVYTRNHVRWVEVPHAEIAI